MNGHRLYEGTLSDGTRLLLCVQPDGTHEVSAYLDGHWTEFSALAPQRVQ